MATVDEVGVEFFTDDSRYNSGLAKIASDFDSKMKAIQSSADKMGNATAVVFDKASGSFKKAGTEVQKYGRNAQVAAGQSANLASQFNDIAVQLQSGTSPLTIALQQGTQISQVLNSIGGSGGVGVLRGLAGGFLSVVNPVSLATIGIIALGGAAVQYISSLKSEVPKADDILKEHERLIALLGPGYEDAIKKTKEYTTTYQALLQAQQAGNAANAKDAITVAAESASQALLDLTKPFNTRYVARLFEDEFKPAAAAITAFTDSVAAGKPDVAGLSGSLTALVANGSLTQEQFDKIAQSIKVLTDEQLKLGDVTPLTESQKAWGELGNAIDKIDSQKAQKEIEALAQKAVDGGVSVDEVRLTLEALARSNPEMSGPILALQGLIDKAAEAAGAIANINRQGMGGRVGNLPGQVNDSVNFGARFGGDDDLATKLTEQKKQIQKEEEALAKERESARKKAERDAAKRAKAEAKQDPYEQFQTRISNQTEIAEQEYAAQSKLNPLIEDYGLAMETARLYQEGLNAAKKAGIDLSPEEQAGLMRTVEGLALVRAESERLAEEQAKVKQSFEEWNETAKTAVGGFLDDLQNGVSLADALHNALDKVLDKLIEVGLNSIFDSKTGIFGGGGGFLSAIFGGARATGGPVSANKAYLVGEKGPEMMIPGQAGTIIPNSRLAAASAGPTTQSGTQGFDVRFIADVDGNGNITPYVTNISRRESTQAVTRSQRTEVQRLPGNMQAARSRGLTR